MSTSTRLACACGQVHLEVTGSPIISTECHCDSCRSAGTRLQALPGAPQIMEANGGTRCVLYRKDRVRFGEGRELLREFRLAPDAPTRRVVASCCNTPVFLEFENGHWLSLYGSLWPDHALPPVEVRTMTGDRPADAPLDAEVPSGRLPTARFYARLLGAWIAMGFRTPKLDWVGERINA